MADRLLHYFARLTVFVTFYKSILLPKDDVLSGCWVVDQSFGLSSVI